MKHIHKKIFFRYFVTNLPQASRSPEIIRRQITKIRSRSLEVTRSQNLKNAQRIKIRYLRLFHYNIVRTKIKSKKFKIAL